MICKNCGSTIPDDSLFCTECGSMVDSQPEYAESVHNDYMESAYAEPFDSVAENSAKSCISKAKLASSLATPAFIVLIVATALYLIGMIPVVGIAVAIPNLILSFFMLPALGLAIAGMILSTLATRNEVLPGSVNPTLYKDYLTAKEKAKKTKTFCIVSFVLYGVYWIISIVSAVFAIVTSVIGGPIGILLNFI